MSRGGRAVRVWAVGPLVGSIRRRGRLGRLELASAASGRTLNHGYYCHTCH